MNYRYILFYKPYGVLSQFTKEAGHPTLADFELPREVYPAGRLDHDSEGLLLLTNDGPFIQKISAPSQNKVKTYWVQVENIPQEESLLKMRKGLKIEDYLSKPCDVRIIPEPDLPPRIPPIRERKSIPTCWLEVTLTEGQNRQVRKMTAKIGHPTLRLVRVKIGPYGIGDLKPGEWKETKKM